MNKTDEELNLAEKMAKRYGVRMCDENGDAHGEELYCVGVDDIADIIREALAESKLAPDGRIPKTVFTIEDISKAAEMGRQAGRIEAIAEQSMSMVLNDPHPPHRLCECTACLEYWTPLPDCDAFAASGKLITEQDHIANAGKMVAEPVKQQRYFCERCGKRVGDKNGVWEGIHTCTPPADLRGDK